MNQKERIEQLTLQEKAEFTTGCDTWSTKSDERLGILPVRVSDGPNGLASPADSEAAVNGEQIKAVCFPSSCATAASFDVELLNQLGEEFGREFQEAGMDVLLGPGVNIKRSPLCGRNFEYYSEDPYLSGEMGASFVRGVQSKGIGTCVKHFCANNQEYRRNDISSEVDERTLREIYLTPFEKIVKEAKPATIMAAYNKINGTYATEHMEILNQVLRKEWGFEGAVISDWGATQNRVAAVKAGCDLAMPADTEHTDEIVTAVQEQKLQEEELNQCVERILNLADYKAQNSKSESDGVVDFKRGHAMAKKAAEESYVLLKNDGILPLDKKTKVAFIGEFAKKPHYQGTGSSSVNCTPPMGAYDVAAEAGYLVTYARGYQSVQTDYELLEEAVNVAKEVETVIVFAGLLDVMEQEGNDRKNMQMPESHCTLIHEICKVNKQTIVVLHNGGPVEMPWVEEPRAILETYLGGEAVGEVTVEMLYGDVNPSGHLAETFPCKLADASSYLFYVGEGDRVAYSERFFVGYRYSCTKEIEPLFPFGHGLSYTKFEVSELTLSQKECRDIDRLKASVKVKNTGAIAGKTVIQLYIAPPREDVIRPLRELKRFQKVQLLPGEEKTITFSLSYRDYAHWEEGLHDWRVEEGEYKIQICANAHEVQLEQIVYVQATKPMRKVEYNMNIPIKDLMKVKEGYDFLNQRISYAIYGLSQAGFISEKVIGELQSAGDGEITLAAVKQVAKNRKLCCNEVYDLENVFDITLDVFLNFITEEEKKTLQMLLEELNN